MPLSSDQLTAWRNPHELDAWVDAICHVFAEPENKQAGLLRQGLAKRFYEEAFPFNRLVQRLYSNRHDIQCRLTSEACPHDAEIDDPMSSAPGAVRVQITCATDGYSAHLRMKLFLRRGRVSMLAPISAVGTERTGHRISVESGPVRHSDTLNKMLALLSSTLHRKLSHRSADILLVAFDDWCWFDSDRDAPAVRDLVHNQLCKCAYAQLYVVGLSGKTFLPFVGCGHADLTKSMGLGTNSDGPK